ncbi:hypothetical protein [Pseudomonas sp. EMN2]|uniref:hypothetical protein n=1 Tax=Pseudomonas sp. EMN2 TaxID=2615212 RepID=UPI00129ABEE8|nr:hypothetical protein [Pseudomonas sp. EMN2]
MNNATMRQHVGVLLEHGQAPYKHEPNGKQSYFVRLRAEGGATETIWGVDLERAIAESGKSVGEGVCLTYLGSRMVKVEAIKRDEAGNSIGVQEIDTERNEWKVDAWSPASHLASGQMIGGAPAGGLRQAPVFPSWRSLLGGSLTGNLLGSGGVSRLHDSVRSHAGTIAGALSEHRSAQAIRTFQALLDDAEKCIAATRYGDIHHAQSAEHAALYAAEHAASPLGESDGKIIRERVQKLIDFTSRAMSSDSKAGFTKEQLANDIVRPLREFKESHEHALKAIGGQEHNLYQIIESALRNLLDFIRSLFRKPDTVQVQTKGPSN